MKKIGNYLRQYPLIAGVIILAVLIVGGASIYAINRSQNGVAGASEFDPSTVLPAPVSQPEASAVYDAGSLKQFDGQDGRKCYVAVKGTVYEIKDSNYWRNGQHTPSGGRGMCGGDMTEAIKQSPHGESILGRLPKVGIFK